MGQALAAYPADRLVRNVCNRRRKQSRNLGGTEPKVNRQRYVEGGGNPDRCGVSTGLSGPVGKGLGEYVGTARL